MCLWVCVFLCVAEWGGGGGADRVIMEKISGKNETLLATTVDFVDAILLWLQEDPVNHDFWGPPHTLGAPIYFFPPFPHSYTMVPTI